MSSTDSYLVEKLKEILLRLYPNQTNFQPPVTTKVIPPPHHPHHLDFSQNISSEKVKVDLQLETVIMKRNEDDFKNQEEILTESLTEFIKVLKMSLNAGAEYERPVVSSQDIESRTQVPTVTMSNTEFQFNLSAEDIADLNDLMNDSQDSVSMKHIFIILVYVIIGIIAIFGNLLVVQLVIRSRRLHTLTHVLLANLAIADLMMAMINIPFSASRVILKEWPFGSFLCQIVPFVQVASVYVISYTMAAIALDRYQVIMSPLGRRMKPSEGLFLVVAIWIVSCLLSLPYALHHKVVNVLTIGVNRRCQAKFDSILTRQWLTVGTFLLQYLIPLLLTTLSYGSIMKRLQNRSSALGPTTQRQLQIQTKAKVKTIRMLILTVICFAVCWAPINAYHLLTHFGVLRHNSLAILISHIIAMSSSCNNPWIFCCLNEHFRHEAARWSRCFRTRRSPFVHPGNEVSEILTRRNFITRNQSMLNTASIRSQLLPSFGTSDDPLSRRYRPEILFLTTVTSPSTSPPPPTIGDENEEDLSMAVYKTDPVEELPQFQAHTFNSNDIKLNTLQVQNECGQSV